MNTNFILRKFAHFASFAFYKTKYYETYLEKYLEK